MAVDFEVVQEGADTMVVPVSRRAAALLSRLGGYESVEQGRAVRMDPADVRDLQAAKGFRKCRFSRWEPDPTNRRPCPRTLYQADEVNEEIRAHISHGRASAKVFALIG